MRWISGAVGALLLVAVVASILRTLVVRAACTRRSCTGCGGSCAVCCGSAPCAGLPGHRPRTDLARIADPDGHARDLARRGAHRIRPAAVLAVLTGLGRLPPRGGLQPVHARLRQRPAAAPVRAGLPRGGHRAGAHRPADRLPPHPVRRLQPPRARGDPAPVQGRRTGLGPEILARQWLVDTETALAELYRAWERQASDIGESHSTYPVLLSFRSPRAHRHWLVGLLSVMDAAAMQLSLTPAVPRRRPDWCCGPASPPCVTSRVPCVSRSTRTRNRTPRSSSPSRSSRRPSRWCRRRGSRRAVRQGGLAALPRLAGQLRGDRV